MLIVLIVREVAWRRAMRWNNRIRTIPAKIEESCTQSPLEKGRHSTIRTLQAILYRLTGKLINFESLCAK